MGSEVGIVGMVFWYVFCAIPLCAVLCVGMFLGFRAIFRIASDSTKDYLEHCNKVRFERDIEQFKRLDILNDMRTRQEAIDNQFQKRIDANRSRMHK